MLDSSCNNRFNQSYTDRLTPHNEVNLHAFHLLLQPREIEIHRSSLTLPVTAKMISVTMNYKGYFVANRSMLCLSVAGDLATVCIAHCCRPRLTLKLLINHACADFTAIHRR